MASGLAGKVAVITGSGDGIGAAIARRLASDGATVIVSDVNDTNGEAVTEAINNAGGKAVYQHADVTTKEANIGLIERAVHDFGSIDILVNNAWGGGAHGFSSVHQKDDATLEHGMAMNYYGPFWAMQAAFPHMYANGWGRVLNICSLNGVNAHMGTLEYNASKEALRTMTRTAAREWAATGITCNVICPGAKTAAFKAFEKFNPEMAAATLAVHPMKRMGDPDEDIAPVAAFLCSDESRYLTGNTLYLDGGGHINGVSWAPELEL